jgi:hypothetical protein
MEMMADAALWKEHASMQKLQVRIERVFIEERIKRHLASAIVNSLQETILSWIGMDNTLGQGLSGCQRANK